MAYIVIPFVPFTLRFLLLILLWVLIKWKYTPHKKETMHLRTSGIVEMFKISYMLFEKTKFVGNRKESRYQKFCNRFLYSSSLYSKEPMLWKAFGKTIALFVLDYDTVNEINTNDAFNDRAPETFLKLYSGGDPGAILMNNFNSQWKEVKRFTMTQLGKSGFRKRVGMSSLLGELFLELLDRIESIRAETGNKIQVKGLFTPAVFNFILTTLLGEKFSEKDPQFIELCSLITEATDYHLFKLLCILTFGNIWGLRDIFGYNRLCYLRERSSKLFRDFVNERQSLGFYKDSPEVLVDYFLQKIDTCKNDDKFKSVYCMEQLLPLIQDLLLAGIDTTSKFLESFIMFMVLYPEVQCKVQQEIDEVIGMIALPAYFEHKSRMNYTLATIYEIHRMANIIPVIPRMTTKDIEIGGQRFKKGTLVANFMFVLRLDDTCWENSSFFCPDRFLDENGQICQDKVDRLLIFGKGPRVCPGQEIAPAIVFTLATGFLQKYSVKKHGESEILGMKEDCGAVSGPNAFHISVFDR